MTRLMHWRRTLSASARMLWRLGFARVILAGGMQRSGSTLLFNVIRLCLEERHGNAVGGGWIKDLGSMPIGKAVVLKVHDFNPVLCRRASKIFYSFRDVRDALVSLKRKFGNEPGMELCRELMGNFIAAEKLGVPMFQYETFAGDVPGTVARVSELLGIPVDVAAVVARVPKADVGGDSGEGYDKTTLMHGRHGTGTGSGAWRRELSPELLRAINDEFGWWLDRHGYPRQ